jgi:hypothetical protein
MRTPFRVVVIALAAVGGLLTACTPAPSAGPTTDSTVEPPGATDQGSLSTVEPGPTGAPTGAAAWCALAPPSLVASTLGIQLRVPAASFTSEEIRCTYVPVAEGEMTIAVRFRVDQTHDTFVEHRESINRPNEPTIDLPAVGDEAFYRTNEFDVQVTQIVVARKGTVSVQLEAPGTLDDCAELVRAILAQLG